jgi:hypothetical protein
MSVVQQLYSLNLCLKSTLDDEQLILYIGDPNSHLHEEEARQANFNYNKLLNEMVNLLEYVEDELKNARQYTAWSVKLLSELRGKIQERFLVASLDDDSSNLVNYMIRKHDYLIVRLALVDGSLKELETKLGNGLEYAKCIKLKV